MHSPLAGSPLSPSSRRSMARGHFAALDGALAKQRRAMSKQILAEAEQVLQDEAMVSAQLASSKLREGARPPPGVGSPLGALSPAPSAFETTSVSSSLAMDAVKETAAASAAIRAAAPAARVDWQADRAESLAAIKRERRLREANDLQGVGCSTASQALEKQQEGSQTEAPARHDGGSPTVVVSDSTQQPDKVNGFYRQHGEISGMPAFISDSGSVIFHDGIYWKLRTQGLPTGRVSAAAYCASIKSDDRFPPSCFWRICAPVGQIRGRLRVQLEAEYTEPVKLSSMHETTSSSTVEEGALARRARSAARAP